MSKCKYCGVQIIGPTPEPHVCISCYNKRAWSSSKSEQHLSNLSSNLLVDSVSCCACGQPMSILDSDDLNFCNECLKLKIECEKCEKKYVPVGLGNCPHCTTRDISTKIGSHKDNEKTNMGYKYLKKRPFPETNQSKARFTDKKALSSQKHNISPKNSEDKKYDKPNKSYKDLLKKLFSDNKSFTSSLNKTKKEKPVEKPAADYKFVKCRECGIEFVPRQQYYHTCPRCFRESFKKQLKNNDIHKNENGHKNHKLLDEYLPETSKIKNKHNDDLFNKIISSYESSIAKIIIYCVKESSIPLTSEHILHVIKGLKSDFIYNNQINSLHTYSILPNITENQFELIINSLIQKSFLIINEKSNESNIIITEAGSQFLTDSNNIFFGFNDKFTKSVVENVETEISDSINLPHRLLNDPKSINRTHIAYLLGETRDPQYVDVLCKATEDPKGNVRIAAASALGKIGEIKAENTLIKLLKDPKQQARTNAVRALGRLNSEKALPLIKNLKNDDSPYVIREVESFLSNSKKTGSSAKLVNNGKKISVKNSKETSSIEVDECSSLTKILLYDPIDDKRAQAAYSLGNKKDSKYLDVLCKATEDESANVRRLAVVALGKIEDKKAEDTFIKLLKDPEPYTRQYAIIGLGKIDSKKALPHIKELTNDSVFHVRNTAYNTLKKLNIS